MKARIALPPKLIPVFAGEADVRGAHGGRGSGKTRSFAKMSAVRAHMWAMAGRTGQILCTRQFMNSLDDSSLEEVKEAIRSEPWLEEHFDIGEKYIKTACGQVHYTFAGLDRNINSVRSKARILLNWTDEAEPVSDRAWMTLIPTLREEDSELWVTWNPASNRSATHRRFREANDPRYKIVELNWRDNPAFPAILERQRLRDLERWRQRYHAIPDLEAELGAIDDWLQSPDVPDAKRKKWFHTVSGALNRKHQESLRPGAEPRRQPQHHETEAERHQREIREMMARKYPVKLEGVSQ